MCLRRHVGDHGVGLGFGSILLGVAVIGRLIEENTLTGKVALGRSQISGFLGLGHTGIPVWGEGGYWKGHFQSDTVRGGYPVFVISVLIR